MGFFNNYYLRILRKKDKNKLYIGCEDGKLCCFDTQCRTNDGLSYDCEHVNEAYREKEILDYFKKAGFKVDPRT